MRGTNIQAADDKIGDTEDKESVNNDFSSTELLNGVETIQSQRGSILLGQDAYLAMLARRLIVKRYMDQLKTLVKPTRVRKAHIRPRKPHHRIAESH